MASIRSRLTPSILLIARMAVLLAAFRPSTMVSTSMMARFSAALAEPSSTAS